MSLLASLENFFNEYIFEPLFDEGISDLYEDSILQDIVQYPIYDRNTDLTGSPIFMRGTDPDPLTVGQVFKGFAGGFLNIGTGAGGSGIYNAGKPYQAPPVKKVSASPSKVQKGLGVFTPTAVDLASNFGVTNAVKANLYKATLSDVPSVKNFVTQLTKTANRRAGVKNKLGSQTMKGTKKRTSFPYTQTPRYFG